MTAVGGFGVTPSCTLIFLTNFIGGKGRWFVMVLLRRDLYTKEPALNLARDLGDVVELLE